MNTQNLQQKNGTLLTKGNCSHHDPIKFLTKWIESSLCNYSDAYVLVTGDIAVIRTIAAADNNCLRRKQQLAAATQVALKNCAPFKDSRTEMNDTFVDYVDFINIAKPMYSFIEYNDNYSDSSRGLWGFERDNIFNNADVTNDDNAPSFKYKASLITNTEANGTKKGIKIVVPLKYLSNFWRSLEMPLINCKIELSLKWIENCVLTTAAIGADANAISAKGVTLKINDVKLYVPVVTLSVEDNVKLVKQLNEVIIKFLMLLLKNIFFQELKLKATISKLMKEIFIIDQLMTRLNNTIKSEKYRQDKVMITWLIVC